MAHVAFTRHLVRFFPTLAEGRVDGDTVRQVLDNLDARHPGLGRYVCEDDGRLRKHVNVFVDGSLVVDRAELSDAVGPDSEVFLVQALSGG